MLMKLIYVQFTELTLKNKRRSVVCNIRRCGGWEPVLGVVVEATGPLSQTPDGQVGLGEPICGVWDIGTAMNGRMYCPLLTSVSNRIRK